MNSSEDKQLLDIFHRNSSQQSEKGKREKKIQPEEQALYIKDAFSSSVDISPKQSVSIPTQDTTITEAPGNEIAVNNELESSITFFLQSPSRTNYFQHHFLSLKEWSSSESRLVLMSLRETRLLSNTSFLPGLRQAFYPTPRLYI